jgi:hypothetical protein
MIRMRLLLLSSLCLSCSQTHLKMGDADAADVPPPAEDGPNNAWEALAESADVSCDVGNTFADSGSPDAANAAVDTQLVMDGPWCFDSAETLLPFLASSLGLGSDGCQRTLPTPLISPEGYILLDNEGRVTSIDGWRVPADKQAWVDSLAGYRWPCLAGETIYYGCTVGPT